MAKARSGGGITSNKVTNKREGTREQPRVRGVSPGGVADLGSMKGSHSTVKGDMPFKPRAMYDGPSFQPVPLGNTLTTNVGGGVAWGGTPKIVDRAEGREAPQILYVGSEIWLFGLQKFVREFAACHETDYALRG
jgi:hypothetical protein